jgi:hypothetical protein
VTLQCTFKRYARSLGGMVVSSQCGDKVLRVYAHMASEKQTNSLCWSSFTEQIYKLLKKQGFIPSVLRYAPSEMADIFFIHQKSLGVRIKDPQTPVLHIFNLKHTATHVELHFVRSISVLNMNTRVDILVQDQKLWIPLRSGKYQVWGVCEPTAASFYFHPYEISYSLQELLSNQKAKLASLRFENQRAFITKYATTVEIGNVLLQSAAYNNVPKVVEMLLQCGAKCSHQNYDGFTALTRNYITFGVSPRIFQLLVAYGADPNLPNANGNGILNTCVEYYVGYMSALRAAVLSVGNMDINAVCKVRRETPLETAVRLGKDDAVRFLLRYGARPRNMQALLDKASTRPFVRQLLQEYHFVNTQLLPTQQ